MEKTIVIEQQPEINNLLCVSRYILLRLPYVKIVAFFVILISLTTFFGSSTQTQPAHASPDWIAYLLVIPIWIFIIFRTNRSLRKNISDNPKNLEPQTLTLNSTGFTSQGQTYKVDYSWKTIYQIKETPNWILIYPNKTTALPVEKENLTTLEYNNLKKLLVSLNVKKQLFA